jgi:adenine-specific DNA-methyltransferase
MDEVFGEENFIAIFPWRKRTAKSDVPFGVSQDYEWILGYTKGEFLAGVNHERNYYQSNDFPHDRWRLSDLTTQRSANERPNSAFDMVDPKTGKVYPFNPKRVWAVTAGTFPAYYEQGKIVFPDDYDFLNISIPAYRVFESEDRAKALRKYGTEEPMKAVSTQLPPSVGLSETGNKEMVALFGSKLFPFPKPVELLKYLLTIVNGEDDCLILDFFAGSGTLAQAVIELNLADDGSRRFILVQLPEMIDEKSDAYKAGYRKVSDLTIERVKRVITQQQANAPLLEPINGFKVYRLAQSRFPRVTFQPDPDKSTEENIAALKQYIDEKEASMFMVFEREAVFDEVLLKQGFPLNYTLAKQAEFAHNDVFLARAPERESLICLDTYLDEATVAYFKTHPAPFFICLERALNTDKKWALRHYLGERLKTI